MTSCNGNDSDDRKTSLISILNNLITYFEIELIGACDITSNDNAQQIVSDVKDIQCSGDLSTCQHCLSLQIVMIKYKRSRYLLLDVNIDIDKYLNDYFHVISKHSKDLEFETIYNIFGGACDIDKCVSFKRNHRDRNKNNDVVDMNYMDVVLVDVDIDDMIEMEFNMKVNKDIPGGCQSIIQIGEARYQRNP
eukprot:485057_1